MAVVVVHCQFLPAILPMAHTAMTGARSSTSSPMTISICTCITSLVDRVIRLAVENRPISSMEKDCTLSNRSSRRLAEKLEEILAAHTAVATDASSVPSAHRSIMPPAARISDMALPSVCTSMVISDI